MLQDTSEIVGLNVVLDVVLICYYTIMPLRMVMVSYQNAQHLFIASIVDRVGERPLDRLGNGLLNALGHNGGFTSVLGVCLASATSALATGVMNLIIISIALIPD
jgi:hypothetical protein